MNFILAILLFAEIGVVTNNQAKITANHTIYDRKDGVVMFDGQVYVDDAEYQLHSDKAYVFLSKTNSLENIVATGNIALTNLNRRAYGDKVSYNSHNKLIVLYGGTNHVAEVREVAKDGDRIVRGRKIKFWVDREQVEVVEADINAPTKQMQNVVPGLGN